jgi:hypothetical protein
MNKLQPSGPEMEQPGKSAGVIFGNFLENIVCYLLFTLLVGMVTD